MQWCGQCHAAVGGPLAARRAFERLPISGTSPASAEPFEVSYSRTAAGPTTFGFGGRIGLTILLIVALWIAYWQLMPFFVLRLFGPAGVVLYLLFAVPVGGWGLRRIWRRERIA